MGFYIRKSLSFGPIRFNLSQSGIGVSAGVKGFRVGTGPRGNYIHVGGGGLYYRATLPGGRTSRVPAVPQPAEYTTDSSMVAIESGAASSMIDHSAEALLQELNTKRKLLSSWPFCLGTAILSLFLLGYHMAWLVLSIFLFLLIPFACWWDRQRKTTVLFYDLNPPVLSAFEALHYRFDGLSRCGAVWNINAQGRFANTKYSAGATTSVQRSRAGVVFRAPPFVKTNIPIPCISARNQKLFFFPEHLLVYDSQGIGAVSYQNLQLSASATRFVEEGSVPHDAQQVGHTWRYVNRDGGPDRRFSYNPQLPILLYGELSMFSPSGLRALLNISTVGVANNLISAVDQLREALASVPLNPQPLPLDPSQTIHYPDGWDSSARVDASARASLTEEVEPFPSSEPAVLGEPASAETPNAVPVPADDGNRFIFFFAQSVQGPFSAAEMNALYEQGKITADSLVCTKDNQQWMSFRQLATEINGGPES